MVSIKRWSFSWGAGVWVRAVGKIFKGALDARFWSIESCAARKIFLNESWWIVCPVDVICTSLSIYQSPYEFTLGLPRILVLAPLVQFKSQNESQRGPRGDNLDICSTISSMVDHVVQFLVTNDQYCRNLLAFRKLDFFDKAAAPPWFLPILQHSQIHYRNCLS